MAVLCLLMAAACGFDYCRRKIPNWLAAAMALAGILFRLWCQGLIGVPWFLAQALVVMGVLYPLFRIGALGAGDVKLFGVTAGYLPFRKIFLFSFVSMLIAAMISLVKLIRGKLFRERLGIFFHYVREVADKGALLPYPTGESAGGNAKVCLSGPVLLSLLLYLGGVW